MLSVYLPKGLGFFDIGHVLVAEGRETCQRHSIFIACACYEGFSICVLVFLCSSFMQVGNECELDRVFLVGY